MRIADCQRVNCLHNGTATGAMYDIQRIGELAKKYGLLYFVDTVFSLGGANVETDKWGIDFNVGLALVSVSEKGWQKMMNRKTPAVTFSFDLLRWKKRWLPKERGGTLEQVWRRQPVAMPVYLVYALAEATMLILEEGVENVFTRHRIIAESVRAALKQMGLGLFCEKSVLSNTLTAFMFLQELMIGLSGERW